MQQPCHSFNEGIALWQQNGFQEQYLFCPHGNRCHHSHILPGTTRRFWFSTQRIREMILERTELRRQQHRLGDANSNSDIDDIATANERLQQAFSEVDAIADQLSSQELVRRYQQIQMEELGRRAVAQREALLRTEEARSLVGPYENIVW